MGSFLLSVVLLVSILPFSQNRIDEARDPIEATSLLGNPLRRPVLPPETEADRLAKLEKASAVLEENPDDPDALIWVGRRTAYLGRYTEAIEIFSDGIDRFPDDPRFLRHRGHRYLTTRRLELAVEDLAKASRMIEGRPDEIEPDGLPNDRGIPTSTLQSNIWYHLGLAQYLLGEFEEALVSYRRGMAVSMNPDGLVSMSYWLYMTLRRLGRDEEAAAVLEPIDSDLDVIENHAYHRLLLMAGGEVRPEDLWEESGGALDDATIGYGIANWHFYNGRVERALEMFRQIVSSEEWPAFGYLAAEAELARISR